VFKKFKEMILLHKQKQALDRIKQCNDFNLLRIKCCKDDDFTELEKQYPSDWFELGRRMNEDYLRSINIDEEAIRIHKLLYEDTIRISNIYDEQKRKENLEQRVKFIENELKDIKRMMR
jgi:hypothetical protein